MLEIKIVNATTGEEIVREMTEKEIEEYKSGQVKIKTPEVSPEEKLAALGLTREDLKALLA